jgi:hypothetical protein
VAVAVPSIDSSVDRGKFDPTSVDKPFAWGVYDLNQSKKVSKAVRAGKPALVTEGNGNQVTSGDDQLEEENSG